MTLDHEFGLHVMDAPLETQDVFQRVRFKLWPCFVARFPLDQILDQLLLRWRSKWATPDRRQHLGTTVGGSHRHHRLHQSELGIV